MNPLNGNSGLKLGAWNFNRLFEETSKGNFFLKQIQLFDIILLSETWYMKDSADKMLTNMDTFMKTYTEKIKSGKKEHLGGF